MATAIARLEREKSISTLAKRLYVIDGDNAAEKQKRAERALLRANPGLSNRRAFRVGRAVVVPADVGLATRDRVSKPAADLEGVLEETGMRFELAAQSLEEQFDTALTSDKETMERLNDKKLVADLRAALPESPKILAKVSAAVKEREGMTAQTRGRYNKAFAKAFSELDRLKELAGRNKD